MAVHKALIALSVVSVAAVAQPDNRVRSTIIPASISFDAENPGELCDRIAKQYIFNVKNTGFKDINGASLSIVLQGYNGRPGIVANGISIGKGEAFSKSVEFPANIAPQGKVLNLIARLLGAPRRCAPFVVKCGRVELANFAWPMRVKACV